MAILLSLLSLFSVSLLAVGIMQVTAVRKEIPRSRLGKYVTPLAGKSRFVSTMPAEMTLRLNRLSTIPFLNHLLSKRAYSRYVAEELMRSRLPLRVGEYLLIRWLVTILFFMLAFIPSNSTLHLGVLSLVIGAAGGIVGYASPSIFLKQRQDQWGRAVNDQLVNAITTISGSLKAGYGFHQGLEVVAKEMEGAISEEFNQMLRQVSLGATIEEALVDLTKRVRSEDLDMVVTAMLIQRVSGGNLAEILDGIATTIRERLRIKGEVRVMTSQGRFSAYIISMLPIGLAAVIFLTNREYLSLLVTTPIGKLMLLGAILLEIVGFIWLRKVVSIEV